METIKILANYWFQFNVLILVFYLCFIFLLRNETFYIANRIYLLLSVILAVIIPFMPSITLTESTIPVVNYLQEIIIKQESSTSVIVEKSSWIWIIVAMYVAGFIWQFLLLFNGFWQIYHLFFSGTWRNFKKYQVVSTEKNIPTFSFFSIIFYDKNKPFPDEKILAHELVHIKQFHTLDVLLIAFLKPIFWCNPVIYWLDKSIKNTHEFLADAAIVKKYDKNIYSELIINQYFKSSNLSFVNHFSQSQIILRMNQLNAPASPLIRLWKFAAILPITAVLFVAFSNNNAVATSISNNNIIAADSSKKSVEVMPDFKGGMDGLMKFMSENIKYPKKAKKEKIQGQVFISFLVDKQGKVSGAKVLKGIDGNSGCNEEALRVVKSSSGKWTAGQKNGKPIKAEMVLPVTFSLE